MASKDGGQVGRESYKTFVTRWVLDGDNGNIGDGNQGHGHGNAPDFEPGMSYESNDNLPLIEDGDHKRSGSKHRRRRRESPGQEGLHKSGSRHRSRSSLHHSGRQHSKRKHRRPADVKPGIKVDTNFSLHKGSTPRQMYPKGQPAATGSPTLEKQSLWSRAKSLRRIGKGSEDLQESQSKARPRDVRRLNSSGGRDEDDSSGKRHGRDRSASSPKASAVPERFTHMLTPSEVNSSGISPSDRSIVFGLSVPVSQPERQQTFLAPSQEPPDTPTIIITPAHQQTEWSYDQKGWQMPHQPRPASSIYSRATNYFPQSAITPGSTPPVPPLPLNFQGSKPSRQDEATTRTAPEANGNPSNFNGGGQRNPARDSTMTAFEEDDDTVYREQTMSCSTIFESDLSPQATTDTSIGAGIQQLTIDTSVPTPRRSKGWWNVITTPFEARNSSRWPQHGSNSPEEPPVLPTLPSTVYSNEATMRRLERAPTIDTNHPPVRSAFSASTVTTMHTPWSPESHEKVFSPYDRISSIPPVPPLAVISEKSEVSVDSAGTSKTATVDAAEYLLGRKLADEGQDASNVNTEQIDRSTVFPGGFTNTTSRHVETPVQQNPHPLALNGSTPSNTPNRTTEPQRAANTPPVTAQAWHQNHSPSQTLIPGPVHERLIERSVDRVFVSNTTTVQQAAPANPPAYTQNPLPPPPQTQHAMQENAASFEAPPRRSHSGGSKSQKRHKKKPSFFAMLFGEEKHRKRHKKHKHSKKKEKRRRNRLCIMCCCCFSFLVFIILGLVLGLTLSKRKQSSNPPLSTSTDPAVQTVPTDTQWLNLTGYPPIPTGISSVAQPDAVSEISGCVQPATVWSCALPKEQQSSIAPNKPDQPNFRLEITFNGSSKSTRNARSESNAASAGAFMKSQLLNARADSSFTPSPSPPSTEDQEFLGNTTDKNSLPFNGEDTPFFITFSSPTKTTSSSKVKRASASAAADNGFSNITSLIPSPAVNSDGTAAAATLLPLPSSQPLRLFNRGQPDEHYGFYTYFDRSIFLKDINGTSNSFGGNPADLNGGSSFDSATMRCTWAQTRFLVQIWTKSQSSKPLLSSATSSSSSATASSTAFVRPGTFPYPVTITMDRHGGDIEKKMIFCYGMDTKGKVVSSEKTFILEDRGFGGILVNPSKGPFSGMKVHESDGGPGGIDGGSGGCQCQWQNWVQDS